MLFPFIVDCRLRPEGESSQLVWDFEKYIEYLNKRARIWEMQSFLKACFVSGVEKLFLKLTETFIAESDLSTPDDRQEHKFTIDKIELEENDTFEC